MSVQETSAFARLREQLAQPSSQEGFEQIVKLLETLPSEEQELAVDYAQEHLKHWPPEHRALHLFEPERLCWKLAREFTIDTILGFSFSPGQLEHFESLRVHSTSSDDLSILDGLPKLRRLELNEFVLHDYFSEEPVQPTLTPRTYPNLDLTHLELVSYHSFERLENIAKYQNLKSLKLGYNDTPPALNFLREFSHLQTLHLTNPLTSHDLQILMQINTLRELHIPTILPDAFEGVGQLTQLKKLSLGYCEESTTLHFLRPLEALEELQISDWHTLRTLDGIQTLQQLKKCSVSLCHSLDNIEALATLRQLEEVHLDWLYSLKDFTPLQQLHQLKTLSCVGSKLESVGMLKDMQTLEHLDLANSSSLKDIKTLHQLKQLETIQVHGCYALEDTTPLSDFSGYQELTDGLKATQKYQKDAKQASRKLLVCYVILFPILGYLMFWFGDNTTFYDPNIPNQKFFKRHALLLHLGGLLLTLTLIITLTVRYFIYKERQQNPPYTPLLTKSK